MLLIRKTSAANAASGGRIEEKNVKWRAALKRNKLAYVGACIVLIVAGAAALADSIATHPPVAMDLQHRFAPPSRTHLLGTDRFGRDLYSRLLYGTRASLLMGCVSTFCSACIGSLLGVFGGLRGGWFDSLLMKGVDILMALPSLLLGMLLVAVLGPGQNKVMIAIGLALLPRFIRVARAPVLSLREAAYVEAARAIGAGEVRVALVHIIPNVLGTVIVAVALWLSTALRLEASLGFLGFGVQEPDPSLGLMVSDGLKSLLHAPHASFVPGVLIAILVLGFNLIGDGLRDVLDPKLGA